MSKHEKEKVILSVRREVLDRQERRPTERQGVAPDMRALRASLRNQYRSHDAPTQAI